MAQSGPRHGPERKSAIWLKADIRLFPSLM